MDLIRLRQWLDAYGAAWRERDPSAAARLFTEDALYHDTPFAEGYRGRAGIRQYWASVTHDQRGVQFHSEPVDAFGDTGIATWEARFELASSGNAVELNGVFILDFDAEGSCKRLREWWHAR